MQIDQHLKCDKQEQDAKNHEQDAKIHTLTALVIQILLFFIFALSMTCLKINSFCTQVNRRTMSTLSTDKTKVLCAQVHTFCIHIFHIGRLAALPASCYEWHTCTCCNMHSSHMPCSYFHAPCFHAACNMFYEEHEVLCHGHEILFGVTAFLWLNMNIDFSLVCFLYSLPHVWYSFYTPALQNVFVVLCCAPFALHNIATKYPLAIK